MKILLLFALFVALILIGGLFYLPFFILGFFVSVNNRSRQAKQRVGVFFRSNGMHIDILLATKTKFLNWPDYICSKNFEHELAYYSYLSIGGENHGFFLELKSWRELTAEIALRVLLKHNTPILMHVSVLKKLPSRNMRVAQLTLSKQKHVGLCKYIYSYFETDRQGQLKLLSDKGYTSDDKSQEAIGSYKALHTCNYWVNKALKKIGGCTALWSPLEKGVFDHLGKVAQ